MTSRSSRLTAEYLNNRRIGEENQMPTGAFHGRIAKGYRYAMALCAILGVGMALLLWNLDPTAAAFFGLIGILAAVTLPTFFSYRCYMDRGILRVKYFILFFKVKKEIQWKDVAYKKIKRTADGTATSIRFYDRKRKKLISFDHSVVGLGKIIRMANKIPQK